jgi:hypothetical protein
LQTAVFSKLIYFSNQVISIIYEMQSFSKEFPGYNWSPFENKSTENNYNANKPMDIARLIEGQKQNGLVDIAILEDPEAMFRMHERVNIRNKPTEYSEALNGTMEWNVLAQVYFSAANMQIIQNALRASVFKLSGGKINIPNQNVDNLKIIMREIYMEYAEHYPRDIKGQVERLNQLVIDHIVPNLYSEAVFYQHYLISQSTLPQPFDRPVQTDRTYKQLSFRPFVEMQPSEKNN